MRISTDSTVQFAEAVAAPPGIPAVGAGTDLAPMQSGGSSGRFQRLRLEGVATLSGPVPIYGETQGVVYKLGVLNGGDDIVLATPGGYAEILQFVGSYDFFGLNPAGVVGTYDGHLDGLVEG